MLYVVFLNTAHNICLEAQTNILLSWMDALNGGSANEL